MNAGEAHATIFLGQLDALSSSTPPTDEQLRALALLVGSTTLLAALDLIDQSQVAKITLPNGRALYQVAGSIGQYTVHPDVRGGYCPCPAFSQLVLCNQSHFICKHLLAVVLADRLGLFNLKSMGLSWLQSLSLKFAAVPAT
ncbi:hypothetical protein RQP46_006779 [Phenoliferia psychrophenolica]